MPMPSSQEIRFTAPFLAVSVALSVVGTGPVLFLLRALATTIALAWFVPRALRLPNRDVWAGMFAAIVPLVLGDLALVLAPAAGIADRLFVLTYPIGAVVGLRVLMLRSSGPGTHNGMLDTAFVSLSVGIVLWSAMVSPSAGAASSVSATTVVLTTLIVGFLAGMVSSPGHKPRALWLLAGGVGFTLVVALVRELLGPNRWLSAAALLARVLVLVTAMADDADQLTRRAEQVRAQRPRVALIGVGLLLLVVVTSIQDARTDGLQNAARVVGLPLLATLLLWRVSRVVKENDEIALALHKAAHTDSLTGLENRRAIQAQVAAATTRHDRRVTLLFVDLNGFKPINDAHGHEVGDDVLVHVAARLRDACGSGDLVGRLGGDEFLILLRTASTRVEIAKVIHRLEVALSDPIHIGDMPIWVGASVGLVTRADGEDTDQLLARADEAMYRAKESTGSRRHVGSSHPVYVTTWSAHMGLRRQQIPLQGPPLDSVPA